MKTYFHEADLDYDGSQLHSLFAYENFGLQGDSIVAFCGACNIPAQNMVDAEDVRAGEAIYSASMLHFIAEHFHSPLELTATRQRLLVVLAKELLELLSGRPLGRRGDDLYFENRKLSISIATVSPVSGLIHLAFNLNTDWVPVPAASLEELSISEVERFAEDLMQAYKAEIEDLHAACCKVKGVR